MERFVVNASGNDRPIADACLIDLRSTSVGMGHHRPAPIAISGLRPGRRASEWRRVRQQDVEALVFFDAVRHSGATGSPERYWLRATLAPSSPVAMSRAIPNRHHSGSRTPDRPALEVMLDHRLERSIGGDDGVRRARATRHGLSQRQVRRALERARDGSVAPNSSSPCGFMTRGDGLLAPPPRVTEDARAEAVDDIDARRGARARARGGRRAVPRSDRPCCDPARSCRGARPGETCDTGRYSARRPGWIDRRRSAPARSRRRRDQRDVDVVRARNRARS